MRTAPARPAARTPARRSVPRSSSASEVSIRTVGAEARDQLEARSCPDRREPGERDVESAGVVGKLPQAVEVVVGLGARLPAGRPRLDLVESLGMDVEEGEATRRAEPLVRVGC